MDTNSANNISTGFGAINLQICQLKNRNRICWFNSCIRQLATVIENDRNTLNKLYAIAASCEQQHQQDGLINPRCYKCNLLIYLICVANGYNDEVLDASNWCAKFDPTYGKPVGSLIIPNGWNDAAEYWSYLCYFMSKCPESAIKGIFEKFQYDVEYIHICNTCFTPGSSSGRQNVLYCPINSNEINTTQQAYNAGLTGTINKQCANCIVHFNEHSNLSHVQQTAITSAPSFFLVMLQRYERRADGTRFFLSKRIKILPTLTVTTLDHCFVYNLKTVMIKTHWNNNSNNSEGSGHFFIYKNILNQFYVLNDDNAVRMTTLNSCEVESGAYMLLYEFGGLLPQLPDIFIPPNPMMSANLAMNESVEQKEIVVEQPVALNDLFVTNPQDVSTDVSRVAQFNFNDVVVGNFNNHDIEMPNACDDFIGNMLIRPESDNLESDQKQPSLPTQFDFTVDGVDTVMNDNQLSQNDVGINTVEQSVEWFELTSKIPISIKRKKLHTSQSKVKIINSCIEENKNDTPLQLLSKIIITCKITKNQLTKWKIENVCVKGVLVGTLLSVEEESRLLIKSKENHLHINNDMQQKQLFWKTWDITKTGPMHEQQCFVNEMVTFSEEFDGQWNNKVCIECRERFPTKSKKDDDSYLCTRCSRYKNKPNPFTAANGMHLKPYPNFVYDCTTLEEMLISPALPFIYVRTVGGGNHRYKGNTICFEQDLKNLSNTLPNLVSDTRELVIVRKGKGPPKRIYNVRRQKISEMLTFFTSPNPQHDDEIHPGFDKITIDLERINSLPEDDIPSDLNVQETNEVDQEATESGPAEGTEMYQGAPTVPLYHNSLVQMNHNVGTEEQQLLNQLQHLNQFACFNNNNNNNDNINNNIINNTVNKIDNDNNYINNNIIINNNNNNNNNVNNNIIFEDNDYNDVDDDIDIDMKDNNEHVVHVHNDCDDDDNIESEVEVSAPRVEDSIHADEPFFEVNWNDIADSPVNEFITHGLFAMCFPKLYANNWELSPDWKYRDIDISPIEIIKHCIKLFCIKPDGTVWYPFASDPRWVFYAKNYYDRHKLNDQVNIMLKRRPDLADKTAEELQHEVKSKGLPSFLPELNRFLSTQRGTNEYWYKKNKELLRLFEEHPPTLFCTNSFPDIWCSDLFRLLGVSDKPHDQQIKALAMNPHISCYYFHVRMNSWDKHFYRNVLGFDWTWRRMEDQFRGAPHEHMVGGYFYDSDKDPNLIEQSKLVYEGRHYQKVANELKQKNKDVPSYFNKIIDEGKFAEYKIVSFVDAVICTINPSDDFENFELPQNSHPCSKKFNELIKNKETIWSIELAELLGACQRHTRCTYYCLRKQKNGTLKCKWFPKELSDHTFITFDDSKGPDKIKVKLVTKRNDPKLNNFNTLQISAFRGNCDIQAVLDRRACCEYVCSYISKHGKDSKKKKDIMNKIILNMKESDSAGKSYKSMLMKTIGNRDIAICEIMYALLSIPFVYCPDFEFITQSLEPSNLIVPNGNDNVIVSPNLLDIYAERVVKFDNKFGDLNKMNFDTFIKTFKTKGKRWTSDCTLVRHTKRVIVQYFPRITYENKTKTKEYANFCKYELVKYKPWVERKSTVWEGESATDEHIIKLWEDFITKPGNSIYIPRLVFEPSDLDGLDMSQESALVEELRPQGEALEMWQEISRPDADYGVEDEGLNDIQMDCQFDWHTDARKYDMEKIFSMQSFLKHQKQLFNPNEIVSDFDLEKIDINCLNERQKKAYDIILNWYNHKNTHKPLRMLLLGKAGTGKSHVLKAIRQIIPKNKIQMSGTTGMSCIPCNGRTTCSLFRLPVSGRREGKLKSGSLRSLQEDLNDKELICIDEISMIGKKQCEYIHQRCCEARGDFDTYFGKFGMVWTGDFAQCPCIGDQTIYTHPQIHGRVLGYDLYRSFDTVIILNEQRRQEGTSEVEIQFKNALDNLRDGITTEDDYKLWKSRQPTSTRLAQFKNAVRLFARNVDVDEYNRQQLLALKQPIARVKALHNCPQARDGSSEDAMGLHRTVWLAKGAKVMLTSNLWCEMGLANGSRGTVYEIIYPMDKDPLNSSPIVLVKFEDYKGPSFLDSEPQIVPIASVSAEWQNSVGKYCSRQQLPLVLAWALTIHKSQGEFLFECVCV